jgi:predicted Zn-dependent protease with MMP-like domain
MDEGEEIEGLLDEAEAALDAGRAQLALALGREAAELDADCLDALFIQAEALLEMGDCRAAEPLYRRLEELAPDEPAVLAGRGLCLFELTRFEAAEQVLRLALELDSRLAEVHQCLGLLLERDGRQTAAERRFARARALAPEVYRPPVVLAEERFDACIEAALLDLPPPVAEALADVSVVVEQLPADGDLRAAEPPLSPQILGLWRGSPLSERSVFDPWTELPGGIVLYQRNLQRFARDEADLIEQIRITVMHEVGHALGLDEQQIAERGWS